MTIPPPTPKSPVANPVKAPITAKPIAVVGLLAKLLLSTESSVDSFSLISFGSLAGTANSSCKYGFRMTGGMTKSMKSASKLRRVDPENWLARIAPFLAVNMEQKPNVSGNAQGIT
jgi:hypothetical protein